MALMESHGVAALGERRLLHGSAEVVVGPSGVVVIAEEHARGRVSVCEDGRRLRRGPRLVIGPRDRTALVERLRREVEALAESLVEFEVDVRGVLCLRDAQFPRFGVPTVDGISVVGPDAARRACWIPGPLGPEERELVARALAEILPAA